MELSHNFYAILQVKKSASLLTIIKHYKNKINTFNNKTKLTPNDIYTIKLLKTALYIFTNPRIKKNYDSFLNQKNQDNELDSFFYVNNDRMKTIDTPTEIKETNILGDRIFSLAHNNKRPGYSTELEIELRKPLQGRIEKTDFYNN